MTIIFYINNLVLPLVHDTICNNHACMKHIAKLFKMTNFFPMITCFIIT